MKRSYNIRYWTQNEFGDFETYGSVYGGEIIAIAAEIAQSYRSAGYHVKVDVTYTS